MKIREMLLGVFIVAIILIIVVPPPAVFLDFLFMINIFLSLLILMNAIYSKKSLEMSMFPTLLLMTTLFRIALNLCSTRLILGEGYRSEERRVGTECL